MTFLLVRRGAICLAPSAFVDLFLSLRPSCVPTPPPRIHKPSPLSGTLPCSSRALQSGRGGFPFPCQGHRLESRGGSWRGRLAASADVAGCPRSTAACHVVLAEPGQAGGPRT